MRKTAATTVLAAALAVSAAPTAHAEEAAVNYAATTTDKSMTIRTDAGSLAVEDGVFKIKDVAGRLIGGAELSFRVDDYVFPIAAEIADRTAVLTPQFDTEHAKYQPVALPYEDQAPWKSQYEREQAAWNRMVTTISTGATIGTLVGGMAGAGVGSAPSPTNPARTATTAASSRWSRWANRGTTITTPSRNRRPSGWTGIGSTPATG